MSDATKVADAEKLDKILSHLDSTAKRLDAMEESRKADAAKVESVMAKMDAEEKAKADAAEKEKADAEEKEKADAECKAKEEEKAKADAAEKEKADAAEKEKADAAAKKADSNDEMKALRAQIDAMARRMPAEVTAEVRSRMVGYQSKAEKVAQAFGDSAGAPSFVQGESEHDYRVRLASKYQKFAKNPKIKSAKLVEIKDSDSLEVFEDAIYADAMAEAFRPSEIRPGQMIPQRSKDAADRTITRYVGDPNACWDQFNPPVRHVRRLMTPGSSRVQ
jgi:colicin import membrane protein